MLGLGVEDRLGGAHAALADCLIKGHITLSFSDLTLSDKLVITKILIKKLVITNDVSYYGAPTRLMAKSTSNARRAFVRFKDARR